MTHTAFPLDLTRVGKGMKNGYRQILKKLQTHMVTQNLSAFIYPVQDKGGGFSLSV